MIQPWLKKVKHTIFNSKLKFSGRGGQGLKKNENNYIFLDVWLSFGHLNTVVVVKCPDLNNS